MKLPRLLTAAIAFVCLGFLVGIVYLISRPAGPVLRDGSINPETISPNADGFSDVTEIEYRIRRAAVVSIYFENSAGNRYYFRQDEPRSRGEYTVKFSGIVDGYLLPGEQYDAEIVTRLLSDGAYTWVIEAADTKTGRVDTASGLLTIEQADTQLPDLYEFSVSPEVFTPNQDGLDDIVWINVYLAKEAELHVSLLDDTGQRYIVPESQEVRLPGEAGRHTYMYDGGVDLGRNPPPDGTYTIVAEAQDAEGQIVRRHGEVTIEFGGMPLAEIVGQPIGDTVRFSSETVIVGDVLTFELTVENYGDAPIRTTGPVPGYVYNQSELYSSTGHYEESGAWRVGIGCDTCLTDYPWRWAVGSPDELTAIEVDGITQYYLMPGQRVVVYGGIRLENIVESRNPQQFWAGLIHEDVEIASVNQRVDPHWIEIVP
nr:hypothetical protein [Anaerolineae bacterium]